MTVLYTAIYRAVLQNAIIDRAHFKTGLVSLKFSCF